ncbi:hypothetical protein WA577_002202, partial [Blastocystis sp. JDR]
MLSRLVSRSTPCNVLRCFSTIPKTMRCVDITKYGGPEVMKVVTRDVPTPKKGEMLIKVAAAAINRPDVIQRQGMYPPPKGASNIPGLECSGTVVAVTEDCLDFKVGDKVCGILTGGGYAEYVPMSAMCALPVPKNTDMIHAAAICESFFTAYSNVFMRGQLKPGESFMVHGGTSGIGTSAIQMAKAFGNKVYTTAEGPEKVAACKKLGADVVVDYTKEDFFEVIKAETKKRGVDVILDFIGGDYAEKNIKLLAEDGRMVIIGFLKGPRVNISLNPILLKRLTITGSTLRSRPLEFKHEVAMEVYKRVWPLIETGKLSPLIHATMPLDDVVKAHTMMEKNEQVGKIVLTME